MQRNQKERADSETPVTRTCIVSGVQKSKENMLRFVVGPNSEIVPDLEEKLPGRGLWLSAERDMLHTACAKNLFAKRARQKVDVDPALAARVEALLARRCLELLRMARRAGLVTAGFDEVRRCLESGGEGLLVTAVDGAEGARRKIAALAPEAPVAAALSADELGQTLGRERVVHVFVSAGRMADRLLRELRRFAGLRGGEATA